jgi:hypothetical protein
VKSGVTGVKMNMQSTTDMNKSGPERSMNSYLLRQSRKSAALFEGSDQISSATSGQQEWLRMEECLQRSRERIEKVVLSMKMASANNVTQFDDEAPSSESIVTSLAPR